MREKRMEGNERKKREGKGGKKNSANTFAGPP